MSQPATRKPRAQKANTRGEHIFAASLAEPLALQWQQLTKAGRHDEANEILGQLVEASTNMFNRLAQFEGYSHTVDLSQLVSAAQARLSVWLLYWDPAKGRLFSWLSKSLEGNTPVLLADGTYRTIKEIVDNRQQVEVVSWDETAGAFVNKPVIDWIKGPALVPPRRRTKDYVEEPGSWVKLSVKHPQNERGRQLIVTNDHEVLTQRGWVEVQDLSESDCLYARDVVLTDYGKSAVIGMYLGDGSIWHDKNASGLGINHGEKQLAYTGHVAKAWKSPYNEGTFFQSQMGRNYTAAGTRINFLRSWPGFQSQWLPHKKTVTPWLLQNLDAVALAYWYMDDGSLNYYRGKTKSTLYGIGLSTESFTRSDCEKLMAVLASKFGIESTFYKRGWADYGSIHIGGENAQKFLELVAPHIPPCMDQKLPPGQKGKFVDQVHTNTQLTACTWKIRPAYNCEAFDGVDFALKYDITVADTYNFVANETVVHNCSKHVFLGEVVKASQHRKRFHSTGDNLEKFAGAVDPTVNQHEAVEAVQDMLKTIHARWGNAQAQQCIQFHIACLVENPRGNRKNTVKTGAYASGLSLELSRFFYNWALYALRDAMFDQIAPRYSEEDVFRLQKSFTFLPEVIKIVGWEKTLKLIGLLGGTKLVLPTLAQLTQSRKDVALYNALSRTHQTATEFRRVAAEHGVTERSAEEVFQRMSNELMADRDGNYPVYA